MSAPYVVLTYALNCFTSSSFAVYVQLATTRLPSLTISALISSSVMSLFRIATCLVPAAALAGADAAVLAAGALAATEAAVLAAGVLEHAAATSETTARSAPIARSLELWLTVSTDPPPSGRRQRPVWLVRKKASSLRLTM